MQKNFTLAIYNRFLPILWIGLILCLTACEPIALLPMPVESSSAEGANPAQVAPASTEVSTDPSLVMQRVGETVGFLEAPRVQITFEVGSGDSPDPIVGTMTYAPPGEITFRGSETESKITIGSGFDVPFTVDDTSSFVNDGTGWRSVPGQENPALDAFNLLIGPWFAITTAAQTFELTIMGADAGADEGNGDGVIHYRFALDPTLNPSLYDTYADHQRTTVGQVLVAYDVWMADGQPIKQEQTWLVREDEHFTRVMMYDYEAASE